MAWSLRRLMQKGTPVSSAITFPVDTPGIALAGDSEFVNGHSNGVSLNTGTWTISRDTNGLITLAKTAHGIFGDQQVFLANMVDATLSVIGDGHYVDANTYTIQTAITGLPIGASTTLMQGTNAAVVKMGQHTRRGLWAHLQSFAKGGLKYQGTFAQGGLLASGGADEVAKAAAAASHFVLLHLGMNDQKTSGVTAAQLGARVNALIDIVTGAGKKCLVLCPTSVGASVNGNGTPQNINTVVAGDPGTASTGNQLIKAHCDGVNSFFIDGHTVSLDVAGTSNAGTANLVYSWGTTDDVHWRERMAYALAQTAWTTLSTLVTVHELLPTSNVTGASGVAGTTILRNRGTWASQGVNAGTLGGGASGILPAGWWAGRTSGTATLVCSVIDPGDGKGWAVQVVITPTAAGDTIFVYPDTTSGQTIGTIGLAAGDNFDVAGELSYSNFSASNCRSMRLFCGSNGGGAFDLVVDGADVNTVETGTTWHADSDTQVFRTGTGKVSASTTSLTPEYEITFSAASASPLTIWFRRTVYDKLS